MRGGDGDRVPPGLNCAKRTGSVSASGCSHASCLVPSLTTLPTTETPAVCTTLPSVFAARFASAPTPMATTRSRAATALRIVMRRHQSETGDLQHDEPAEDHPDG